MCPGLGGESENAYCSEELEDLDDVRSREGMAVFPGLSYMIWSLPSKYGSRFKFCFRQMSISDVVQPIPHINISLEHISIKARSQIFRASFTELTSILISL